MTQTKEFPFNFDDINHSLLALGRSLSLHRKQVLKLTQKQFSDLLGVSEPTLRKMEKGDDGVSIGIWLRAFQMMQVEKSVVTASRPDTLILANMFKEAEHTNKGGTGVQSWHEVR